MIAKKILKILVEHRRTHHVLGLSIAQCLETCLMRSEQLSTALIELIELQEAGRLDELQDLKTRLKSGMLAGHIGRMSSAVDFHSDQMAAKLAAQKTAVDELPD